MKETVIKTEKGVEESRKFSIELKRREDFLCR